jgi:hypothetical protein
MYDPCYRSPSALVGRNAYKEIGEMRTIQIFAIAALLLGSASDRLAASDRPTDRAASVAVGAQYDSTHAYVAPGDLDRFTDSLVSTFGGTKSRSTVLSVTPTPSETAFEFVFTPVGTFSVFAFKTPIPYPFGTERTGYLVTDLDAAVRSAKAIAKTRSPRSEAGSLVATGEARFGPCFACGSAQTFAWCLPLLARSRFRHVSRYDRAMPERRFPPPWSVEELDSCFLVKDANGQALAYMYFEKEPRRPFVPNCSRATRRCE